MFNQENNTAIINLSSAAEFRDNLKKLSYFIDKKSGSQTHGIYLFCSDSKLTLCATNGHILCEIVMQATAICNAALSSVTIAAKSVKDIIKLLPGKKGVGCCIRIESDQSILIESGGVGVCAKTTGMPFPDYQRYIPNRDEIPELKFGFNARYMHAILGALGDAPINIYRADDRAPHLLTATNNDYMECVIMPMRL